MFYDFEVTITAGTTQASPKEVRMKMGHGIIHLVRIDFPPGPRGEVYLIILEGGKQVYPYNQGGYFRTDNKMILFDDYKELFDAPYELVARAWSPSADYDHTIHIEIGIIESKIALASLSVARGLEKFFKVLGLKV